MSFQAYLDAVERKTGQTPRALLDQARAPRFGADTPSADALRWLADEHGLGRGHGMALIHVLKNGPTISDKHVGTSGSHRDESAVLHLDGLDRRPAP